MSKKLKQPLCYSGSPTCMVCTSTISTSTNFQKVLHKVVLVGNLISRFVLVELTVCTTQLNSVSKRKWQNKWPFYDHFWPFFRLLYIYLSQNWGSDYHFGVISRPKIWLVLRLRTQNANISIFGVLQFCTKTCIGLFYIFAFCVITFVPIMIWTR